MSRVAVFAIAINTHISAAWLTPLIGCGHKRKIIESSWYILWIQQIKSKTQPLFIHYSGCFFLLLFISCMHWMAFEIAKLIRCLNTKRFHSRKKNCNSIFTQIELENPCVKWEIFFEIMYYHPWIHATKTSAVFLDFFFRVRQKKTLASFHSRFPCYCCW